MTGQLNVFVSALLVWGIANPTLAQWPPMQGCPNGMCPRPIQQPFPPQPQFHAQPEIELAPHLRGSIVRIANDDGRGMSLGSGTLVEKNAELGLVLTCAHLFREGLGTLTVTFPAHGRFGAKLVACDPSCDLAALVIAAPPVDAVPVAIRPRR